MAVLLTGNAKQVGKQTLAPHEMNDGDAPPAIRWKTPGLPDGGIHLETAEERHLRVVVVAKGLQNPGPLLFYRTAPC